MTLTVALRPAARADLDAIWDYTVTTWSQDQAVTYLGGLGQVFDKLAQFPEMARLRDEFTPAVRIMPYQRHLVIYTADDTTLDVIRVVHSKANWAALLAD
ncbi:MAG: type II toxin-antitoxin system RelE/ParE family toxin [Yoonia sp.]|uniref:type II toxin-antitoxin system RelE/ParE family toxin n=1 Tax=Yoonia sp. TaxID=2212373 RepID=UPI003262FE22